MKERPILFTPGNVRAILDGTKTQTRRIVKPEPVRVSGGIPYRNPTASLHGAPGSAIYRCPYGQRGDRLWVRETHSLITSHTIPYVVFKDGGQKYQDGGYAPGLKEYSPNAFRGIKWRRSIHMPRWACRTVLAITEVRVQRLQECSSEDAMAEGVEYFHAGLFRDYLQPGAVGIDGAIASYQSLWESINGAGSWDANPWVWAISFKKVSMVDTSRTEA